MCSRDSEQSRTKGRGLSAANASKGKTQKTKCRITKQKKKLFLPSGPQPAVLQPLKINCEKDSFPPKKKDAAKLTSPRGPPSST